MDFVWIHCNEMKMWLYLLVSFHVKMVKANRKYVEVWISLKYGLLSDSQKDSQNFCFSKHYAAQDVLDSPDIQFSVYLVV